MKRFALTLVAAVSAAPLLFTQDLTQEQISQIQKLFQEGRGHYEKKEYEKSTALYREVLERLPNSEPGTLDINRATVLFHIGSNYALADKKKEAFETLSTAVEYGYWNSEAFRRAPDLASLRSAKEFDALVRKSQTALGSIAFGLKDLNGKVLEKKDYEGKVLVLDVWGTWCGPCRMEIPHFVRLQKEYKDKGFAVIGLTWEQRPPNKAVTAHVKTFAANYRVNYPMVMLTPARLSAIPDLQGFPTTFFVGRDGTVRDRVSGYQPYELLKSRVAKLLKEKPPAATAQVN